MASRLAVGKTGLSVAFALVIWHACWLALVALKWAQPVLDFVFRVHFIRPVYVVETFELVRAATLLGLVAVVGLFTGIVFALIWNALHGE